MIRRDVLIGAGLVTGGSILAACTPQEVANTPEPKTGLYPKCNKNFVDQVYPCTDPTEYKKSMLQTATAVAEHKNLNKAVKEIYQPIKDKIGDGENLTTCFERATGASSDNYVDFAINWASEAQGVTYDIANKLAFESLATIPLPKAIPGDGVYITTVQDGVEAFKAMNKAKVSVVKISGNLINSDGNLTNYVTVDGFNGAPFDERVVYFTTQSVDSGKGWSSWKVLIPESNGKYVEADEFNAQISQGMKSSEAFDQLKK
jgi:hypothetical protein